MLPSLLPSFWPGIGEPNVIKAMSGKYVLTETFRRTMPYRVKLQVISIKNPSLELA